MKTRYGNKLTIRNIGGGIVRMEESVYHDGVETQNMVTYKSMVRVKNDSDELAEFLRFQQDTKGKDNRSFTITEPALGVNDGSHFIEKYWTEPI